jgi:hypothetical protein
MENKKLQVTNGPDTWGSVFSLEPNTFMDNFAPVLIGLITLSVHLPGEESWNPIGVSWKRYFVWFMLVALFANIGYAGNFGIVVGFFNVLLACTCLVVRFSNEERRPTDLDVVKEMGAIACFETRLTVMVSLGRMLTMLGTIMTFIVGLVHLFSQLKTWCDDEDEFYDPDESVCLGPLLFWGVRNSNVSSVVSDRNDLWRSVIGLTPAALANNFAPLIIGVLMMLAHRKGSAFQFLLRTWYRVSMLCVHVALFAGFGFAGNVGVIAGFVLSVASAIHLIVALLDADVQRPFLEIQFQFLAPENANDSPDEDVDHNRRSRSDRHGGHGRRSSHQGRRHGRDDRDDRSVTSSDESQSDDEISTDDVDFKRRSQVTSYAPGFFGRLKRQMSSSLNTDPEERRRRKGRRGDDSAKLPVRSKSETRRGDRGRRNDRDIESGRRATSKSKSRARGDNHHKSGDEGRRSSSRARDSSRSPRDNHRSSSSHRHVGRA